MDLFVLGDGIDGLPADTEVHFQIFNMIFSNWVYRYNDCIYQRRRYGTAVANVFRIFH